MGSSFSARRRREERLQSLMRRNEVEPQQTIQEASSDSNSDSDSPRESNTQSHSTNSKKSSKSHSQSGTPSDSETDSSYSSSYSYDMDKPTYKRYVDSSFEEVSSIKNSIKQIPNNQVKRAPRPKIKQGTQMTIGRKTSTNSKNNFKKKKSILTVGASNVEVDSEKFRRDKSKLKKGSTNTSSRSKRSKRRFKTGNTSSSKKSRKTKKEKSEEIKEDSFFRDFNPSLLDFSNEIEKSFSKFMGGEEQDDRVLIESIKLENKKNPKFKNSENIDISPIVSDADSSSDEEQKEEEILEKVEANDVLDYDIPFEWGESGQVDIRTIKYNIEYNPEMKGFKLKKSDRSYLRTLLTWKRDDEDERIFNFGIRDEEIIDIVSGQNFKLKLPILKFKVDSHGNFLGALNTQKVAHNLINLQRKQEKRVQPNQEEVITNRKVWKKKAKALKDSMNLKLEETWLKILENWNKALKRFKEVDQKKRRQRSKQASSSGNNSQVSDSDSNSEDSSEEDQEKHLKEVKEVEHFERDCLLLSQGNMSNQEEIREHLLEKVIDPRKYPYLKKSKNFIVDPLSAWGLRGETAKVRIGRRKFEEMEFDDFLDSEYSRDFCTFYATEKYDIASILIEKETLKPHIMNTSKSTRIVFDTFDGAFVQVEEQRELVVFLWEDTLSNKKREEYFYSEVSKFRKDIRRLFTRIMGGLLKMRTAPLKFKPGNRKAFIP